MVDFEITRKQKILEINNCMCHNYYYLIHGKIYNGDKTKYKKFKYIEFFDIFDLQEYFDKEIIAQEDIKQYLNEIENCYLLNIKNYEDTKEFFDFCNKTIKNYNKIAKSR